MHDSRSDTYSAPARSATALSLLLALAGCATSPDPVDPQAQANAIAARPAAPTDAQWPDPATARWREGTFPRQESLRKMAPGLGKDQVRDLLGVPHFSEGLFGVREWDYLFQFKTGNGAAYKTCQYMVRFDDTPLITGFWWRTPECAAMANPPAVAALPATTQPPTRLTLHTDALFSPGGSREDQLTAEGRNRILQLAQSIKAAFAGAYAVLVTGYTDRLGTDAQNEATARQRAATVGETLERGGIDAQKIQVSGMGSQSPVITNCPGTRPTPELLKCLQPNRRVEIEVRQL